MNDPHLNHAARAAEKLARERDVNAYVVAAKTPWKYDVVTGDTPPARARVVASYTPGGLAAPIKPEPEPKPIAPRRKAATIEAIPEPADPEPDDDRVEEETSQAEPPAPGRHAVIRLHPECDRLSERIGTITAADHYEANVKAEALHGQMGRPFEVVAADSKRAAKFPERAEEAPAPLADGCRIIWTDNAGRDHPGIYRFTLGGLASLTLDDGPGVVARCIRVDPSTIRRDPDDGWRSFMFPCI